MKQDQEESPAEKARSIDVLARTLWGEARGEGEAGMKAVAAVILNRVARAQSCGGRFWWGNSIITVCRKKWQFSCWNDNDPNYQKLLLVDRSDKAFHQALKIARAALEGRLIDPTNGATHYHTRAVLPKWAVGQKPCCTIGNHLFYKLEA